MPTRRSSVDLVPAFLRMTRNLKRGVPEALRYRVYDLRRGEPRNVKPLGIFPELATACLQEGAPIADVFAPLFSEQDRLMVLAEDLGLLPGPEEIRMVEKRANDQEDLADIEYFARPSVDTLDLVVEANHVQEIASIQKRAVLLREHR